MQNGDVFQTEEERERESDLESTGSKYKPKKQAKISLVKQEIIKNVQQTYISKLQGFNREMKIIEKQYIDKMADLYGKDGLKRSPSDRSTDADGSGASYGL